LGLAEEVGTLEVGRAADLCVVHGPAANLPPLRRGDTGGSDKAVAEALVGEEHEVIMTMIAGEVVFEEEGARA
jgi:cytosine/adenosine deaminase-related metal-dependent hydrolase